MHREIIEYKTVSKPNNKDLDKKVNKLLKEGYQLYGNPYALDFDYSFEYYQAMVKYKETE